MYNLFINYKLKHTNKFVVEKTWYKYDNNGIHTSDFIKSIIQNIWHDLIKFFFFLHNNFYSKVNYHKRPTIGSTLWQKLTERQHEN